VTCCRLSVTIETGVQGASRRAERVPDSPKGHDDTAALLVDDICAASAAGLHLAERGGSGLDHAVRRARETEGHRWRRREGFHWDGSIDRSHLGAEQKTMARLRSGSDAKLSEDKGHAEGPGDTAVLSLANVMKGGMNESRAFEALVEWARDSSACSGGYCD
jgi:hypothetical protein